jgi:hypothetical protein
MVFVLVVEMNRGSLWETVFLVLMGGVFLFYGLTREPLYFNRINRWKKPSLLDALR